MRANEFVKKFGWGEAKNIVDGWICRDFDDSYHIADGIYCNLPFEPTDDCGTLSLFDLKRLVESYELVEKYGGLDKVKSIVNGKDPFELTAMQGYFVKAIADVESCIGEQNEI